MKIAISVHGRFHAFALARELAARGALSQVATTYPAFVARRWLAAPIPLRTAPWLEAWRRLHGRLPLVPPPEPGLARAFARFAARTLPGDADMLVGWSAATLEAIGAARRRGMKVVLERGSTHIAHQTEVLAEAYARLGLPSHPIPSETVARETQEYAEADAIVVPTRFAAATFVARGVSEGKVIVNPLGVDTARFASAASRSSRSRPVILFVGEVGVRKGVASLLSAFAPLADRAELRLVGPVERGFATVLARLPSESVRLSGPLSGGEIVRAYREADIFCLPSHEEGFGMALAEAMASGLPAIASDMTAAADLIESGEDGLVVPAGDERALGDALAVLVSDAELRARLGAAARAKIEGGFTWGHYGDRAMAAYRRVLGGTASAG